MNNIGRSVQFLTGIGVVAATVIYLRAIEFNPGMLFLGIIIAILGLAFAWRAYENN